MNIQSLLPRGDAPFDLYPYTPSAKPGYAFMALFALGGLIHLGYMFTLRSWFFFPLILGCAAEAGGYYARAWSHSDIRNGSPYLIQLMLILAAAPLIAATIYMTLGRLIRALDAQHHAVIRPSWTTKIYVLIDIVSLVCQLAGSAMQASNDPAGIQTGIKIVMGGLGFQLVALAGFIIMTAVFHARLNKDPTATSERKHVNWRRHVWTLYAVSLLVFVRSLYRLIEYVEGPGGAPFKTEVYLYIFDASLMFLVVVTLAISHPGLLLRHVRKAAFVTMSDNGDTSPIMIQGQQAK